MISPHVLGSQLSLLPLLAEFVVTALLVLLLATWLTRCADDLEKQTHISALWIGALFLAIVTSLPEAVVTLGASVMEGTLDLGVANLAGSNLFNLLILVLLDALWGAGALHTVLDVRLRRPAVSGMAMMVLVGTAVMLHRAPLTAEYAGWVGPGLSCIVFAWYVVSMMRSGGQRDREQDDVMAAQVVLPTGHKPPGVPVRKIVQRMVVSAALLVLVSVWLLKVCDAMATTPFTLAGRDIVLGRTVTGSFLLSAATSFPELFVCIVALRLGQANMAVANVLGSNMVNMCFVPVMHLASRRRLFYAQFEPEGILVLFAAATLMTLLFLGGFVPGKQQAGRLRLGWASWGMLVTYVAGAVVVLRLGLRF